MRMAAAAAGAVTEATTTNCTTTTKDGKYPYIFVQANKYDKAKSKFAMLVITPCLLTCTLFNMSVEFALN